MIDFTNLPFDLFLIIKIIFLLLIGLYGIFAIFVFNQIRSLNRVVYIRRTAGSPFIQSLAFFYLLATLALFLFALAIL